MTARLVMIGGALALALAAPASAQTGQALKDGCSQTAAAPATPPGAGQGAGPGGSNSGTAAGNLGSTGWSGAGLGGAYSGTSPSGPVSTSPSFHPVTAKGIDPIKGMATKPRTC